MAGNYLMKSRHGTVYYFRRRVPIDLQSALGRKVLVLSLETSERRLAVMRGRAVAVQTDAVFQHVAMAKKSGKSGTIRTDYSFEISLSELGLPSIKVNAEPHEMEAVNSNLKTALEAIAGRGGKVDSTKPQKRFVDAVGEFYRESQLKPSSKQTFRARLRHAQEHFGEGRDVLAIQQSDFAKYCSHVQATVEHPTTQNLYMSSVARLINWHGARVLGRSLVSTKTFTTRKTTPDSEDRDAFTLDQLRLIFENAKQYWKSSPCKFWASIAPVFTGCRIEELCQINLKDDVREDTEAGIWYLALDERPDADGSVRKSIKKTSSWRVAPIHPALVKHGFVEFLKAQQRAGYSRPFESEWKAREVDDPELGRILKWSHYISRWGGRELAKLRMMHEHGFEGKLGYFHSQRHSCKGALLSADVREDISEAIAGRNTGSSDSERYGKLKKNHRELYTKGIAVGLDVLSEMLDKVVADA